VWYCLTYFQCGYLGSGKWRFETVGNGKEIRIKGSYVSKGWRGYGIRITLCILIVHHFFFVLSLGALSLSVVYSTIFRGFFFLSVVYIFFYTLRF
jgi:hypothetical protein